MREEQGISPKAYSAPLSLEEIIERGVKLQTKKGNFTSKGGKIKISESFIKREKEIEKVEIYFARYGWEVYKVNGPRKGFYEFEIRPGE